MYVRMCVHISVCVYIICANLYISVFTLAQWHGSVWYSMIWHGISLNCTMQFHLLTSTFKEVHISIVISEPNVSVLTTH